MRYADIIGKMTLEEKASLLSGGEQFRSKSIERLGISAMTFADGPHGVRKQAGSGDHLGLNESLPATCYPTASAIANSWDEKLGEELGGYLGKEAAFHGVNMLLGPGFNIKRSPLCGRNFEYFSEDPLLAGKMAAAFIRGIQGQGVSACPKHYAVNNQETLRQHSDSVLDERTLREIYLTAFEIAVKEGGALGIMSSYNKVNGTYASECPHLLTDILVNDWGFKGIVVTDWGGSNDRVAAVKAGGHIEMPETGGDSDREVVAAVRAGTLNESRIDEILDAYLSVLFATKLPEDPAPFDEKKHHNFAREAAKQSIVLLKNDALLPLKADTSVAVIGNFADVPRFQGFGSSVVNPTKVERPLDFLIEAGLSVTYRKGYDRYGKLDAHLLSEAENAAKSAEVAIVFIGLDEMSEIEGCDRAHMRVNQNQVDVLEAVAAVNPNTLAVFCGGAPFEVPWIDKCKAVLHGYLGGQAGASALAATIMGLNNPSGKLAETWPIAYDDTPARTYYPGAEKTAEYRESIFVGYRYYDKTDVNVRFPFGYGLSYTSFDYSNLEIDGSNIVSFTVKNTGEHDGAEIAQMYIGLSSAQVFRAPKELKGFTKVYLKAGEERKVSIELNDMTFRYFNVATNKYEIEGGEYQIMVGASSKDIRLHGVIQIDGTNAPNPYNQELLPSYYSGSTRNVSDAEFSQLLGKKPPSQTWNRNVPLEMNDTFAQLFYARGLVGRLVYKIMDSKKKSAEKKGKPILNIMFIYNMPFRGMAKSTGGIVNMEMAQAVVFIFNGHFFRGTGRLIRAHFRKRKAVKATARLLASGSSKEAN